MKKITLILLITLFSSLGYSQENRPMLKKNQLWVDGKPFLMIGGELHNSTASSKEYMETIWPKLKQLHLNTVLATITWEQIEPQEGKYDFTLLDYLIKESEKNGLKLVVVWFGSWKNGQSSYIPLWVKKDTKRFPRVKTKEGKQVETLSVISENSMKADAKAFAAMMKRIKEVDKNNTVIMIQPENEVGIFQDIDYREEVLAAYSKEVPKELISNLKKNEKLLKDEVKSVWVAEGKKSKGSWKTVFGDNPQSKEFFMAWNYASYINFVAENGRKEHDLPMFVNAWIVQKSDDLPGVYPNGGPVSRVMDIYKAAAPSIDIVSPDIYLSNYQEIYTMYHRREDNPLLVPESSLDAARAFYAFAEFDAICFSPFGIEDAVGDLLYENSYQVLNELMPTITTFQGTGKMRGIHLSKDRQDELFNMDGYEIAIKIQDPEKPAFGLIIKTDDEEFLISGMNFKVQFNKKSKKNICYIGQVYEGRFDEKNQWVNGRMLNGDETYHNELVRVFGREIMVNENYSTVDAFDLKEGDQFVYSPGSKNKVMVPGIYKVLVYQRPEY